MLGKIKRFFSPPSYRIVYDAEYGFFAAFRDTWGWWAIRDDGQAGVHPSSVTTIPEFYFVRTEKEAGDRINKHATNRGRSIVWEG